MGAVLLKDGECDSVNDNKLKINIDKYAMINVKQEASIWPDIPVHHADYAGGKI